MVASLQLERDDGRKGSHDPMSTGKDDKDFDSYIRSVTSSYIRSVTDVLMEKQSSNAERLVRIETQLQHLHACLHDIKDNVIAPMKSRINELEKNWWRVVGAFWVIGMIVEVIMIIFGKH